MSPSRRVHLRRIIGAAVRFNLTVAPNDFQRLTRRQFRLPVKITLGEDRALFLRLRHESAHREQSKARKYPDTQTGNRPTRSLILHKTHSFSFRPYSESVAHSHRGNSRYRSLGEPLRLFVTSPLRDDRSSSRALFSTLHPCTARGV